MAFQYLIFQKYSLFEYLKIPVLPHIKYIDISCLLLIMMILFQQKHAQYYTLITEKKYNTTIKMSYNIPSNIAQKKINQSFHTSLLPATNISWHIHYITFILEKKNTCLSITSQVSQEREILSKKLEIEKSNNQPIYQMRKAHMGYTWNL